MKKFGNIILNYKTGEEPEETTQDPKTKEINREGT
jgi:hypothetical protein